uniref:Phytanoyl-CoA dioxygenase n=1 Tax=Cyanothece sp. (strain PCC 7425 / ATCC 29141) TaxID=395961 RepID=B8HXW9_CYAP4
METRNLGRADFWQSLCPYLRITDHPFTKFAAPYEIDDIHKEHFVRAIIEEGYFQIPSIIPKQQTDMISNAITDIVSAGFPPPFVLLYDELWQIFGRLENVLRPVLGESYYVVPDFWIWKVDPKYESTGWTPHRDEIKKRYALRSDGRPPLMTVWIPFTDATPLNSCIYVLPTHLDPNYPDKIKDFTISYESLQHIRALPATAGSIICWNQYLLHWGSSRTQWVTNPRISIGIYFQSADVAPFDISLISLNKSLPFQDRLGIVSYSITKYIDKHYKKKFLPDELLAFCENHSKLYRVCQFIKKQKDLS